MVITANYNPSVSKAQRNLSNATAALNLALERMSTGFKVNRAADDAAGLYIATKLNTQIRGLTQAKKNTQDGVSLLNTASGSLNNMTVILNRLRDLSVQAANGVYDTKAREAMQTEIEELTEQLYQIKNGTNFNGKVLFGNAEEPGGFPQPVERISEQDAIAQGYTVIKSVEDLNNIRNNLNGKYILMGNIDLSAEPNWIPIGDSSLVFAGKFNGNGYKIKNMTSNRPTENYVGLFGATNGAIITNLAVTNANITGLNNTGIMVGDMINSTIENCYSTGTANSTGTGLGGIAGTSTSSRMFDTYSTANLKGKNHTGGLIGRANGSSLIQKSYFSGSAIGSNDVGGLVGYHYNDSKIYNSYSTGYVKGVSNVGGIVGELNLSSIITNCYSNGKVEGTTMTAGFVGKNNTNCKITNSFWDVEKSGQSKGDGENTAANLLNFTLKGLTTNEMNTSSIFKDAGWQEADWSFYEGFSPRISWQPPPAKEDKIRLQVGANSDKDSAIFFNTVFKINDLDVDVSSAASAARSINEIDSLLAKVSTMNSEFGAVTNRLDSVMQSQTINIENLTASKSTIMDADIAAESASYVKNQILQQTSSSLLIQSQTLTKDLILKLIVK